MKKELKIYIFILIILSIIIHYKEFLTHPVEHVLGLMDSGAYGFGGFHPFIFSAVIYIIIGIPRVLFKIITRRIV
ncbi:hypothetical protein [Aliarcobacter cibarius]|uniref:Putative membrane protein n=1 Tax=Aliarcobacter cibarius TaxID=255507 RepID=A0A7L5JRY8_9BACT|nr:hypothetical protein [Aliarcobacter cibarius]QKJ27972.1 putative membrane protein [Aliarcobacter cibarius]TLT05367.1 hypothetical protein FE248_01345 [Aliarcobacter cibarius]